MRSSSPTLSTLITLTPNSTALRSSNSVFPTPVKIISEGLKPARRATSISPPEFASTLPPNFLIIRAIARVELAFRA